MQSLFAQFQTRYPSGGLITELLTIHDGNYVVRALINVGDRAIATGMAAAPTVEAAEDQARLRALQMFNQLSNPITPTEGLALQSPLQPQFLPGLSMQPNLQPNVAASQTSGSGSAIAAATLAASSPRPSPAPSPVVPTPINGGATGLSHPPSTVVASSQSQAPAAPAAKVNPTDTPTSSTATSVADSVAGSPDWSVDLSAAPDSTLPTNFSITPVPSQTSPKPVADLYAAATEESVAQPWNQASTAEPDRLQSPSLAGQNGNEPEDNQAIPFLGDDPLEPELPDEDFAPPTETEATVPAKATKAKTAKSAKSTKSASSNPPTNPVIDRSDEIAQIDVEMRRLGWSKQDGRKHLEQTYNKRSRQQLTDDELLAFLAYLQTQPSPSQSPF